MAGEISGIHGLRVTVLWLTASDIWPTWYGVLHNPAWADWAGVLAQNATWQDLLDNAGTAGIDLTEDVTCAVEGLTIERGRDGVSEHVKASTLTLTLRDDHEEHDPRRVPAGPSRVGSRITVEVQPENTGPWRHLGVFFVESWATNLDAVDARQVTVEASDALHFLARARPINPPLTPVGGGELSGARINRILDAMEWLDSKWGARDIDAGTVPMNPTMHDARDVGILHTVDVALLDEAHQVVRSEDGLLDVTPEGDFRFQPDGWRDANAELKAVIDLTGILDGDPLPIVCPVRAPLEDSDLDVATRVTVSRSVEYDPDTPSGDRPEEVKRSAQNDQAVNRFGPIQPFELTALPHTTNARSSELAQRWVDRLSMSPNVLGEVELSLVKRPKDTYPVLDSDWGDVWFSHDYLERGRTLIRIPHEFVGVRHDITPHGWQCQVRLDHFAGDLPSAPAPVLVGAFSQDSFDRLSFDTMYR